MVEAKGGTEILYDRLAGLVDLSRVNLIKSNVHPNLLDPARPNILWEHLSYDQPNVQQLKSQDIVSRLDAIVFVSHWQHDHFRRHFPIPGNKCHVIQNATEPCAPHEKPKGKIRLVYTSTPWRGLKMLIDVWKRLNRQDVELVVYSGTKIYGQEFHAREHPKFVPLYEELKRLPNVTHIDYAPNHEVREALKECHIMAYPNTWEETSCLATMEALMAGCKVVTSSYGALPETCGIWADYIPASVDMASRYAELLNNAIDTFWDDPVQAKLVDQVKYYNQYWTWEKRIEEWKTLIYQFQNTSLKAA